MKIGVLALQGDFREHLLALSNLGVAAMSVRRTQELDAVDALVLPGGESTTIAQLAQTFGLFQPIVQRITQGMPIYGSCAGMILLADKILDSTPGQRTFGGLDVTVRRNAFGRQVDSFEGDIAFSDGNPEPIRALFIRAPWVEVAGKDVEIMASATTTDGVSHPVAVRQGAILATSFHPELMADGRVHRYFIEQVCNGRVK